MKINYRKSIIRIISLIIIILLIGIFIISCNESKSDDCEDDCLLEVADINITDIEKKELIKDEPIKVYLFFHHDCTLCDSLKQDLKNNIKDKLDLNINLITYDYNESLNDLSRIEEESGIKIVGSPILIIGKYILSGENEIKQKYVNAIIETAKTPVGFRQDWIEECTDDCQLEVVEATNNNSKLIYDEPVKLYYFYEEGCDYCYKLKQILQNEFTDKTDIKLDMKILDITKEIPKIEALRKKTGQDITGSPILIVGKYIMSGKTYINDHYNEYIYNVANTKPSKRVDLLKNLEEAKVNLPGLLFVITMGLADGINPCAFATIIFLISYLAYAKKTKRETLIIGSIYTGAVFITYFLVGFVFYGALSSFITSTSYRLISTIIKIVSIALVSVLAIVTLGDFIKALRGKAGEMTLTLSGKMKQRIHSIIRNKLKLRGIIISSLIIGIVVSFFELACTGQVYLPTILYIVNDESTGFISRSYGYLQLLIYNIAFIMPLLIIFLISYFGVSSKALQNILQKHTATIKFLLFLLFAGLTVYMVLAYFIFIP